MCPITKRLSTRPLLHFCLTAVDPKILVGVLGQFPYDVRFFTETEGFDRYLEKLRRGSEEERGSITLVSARPTICTTPTAA